MVTVMVMERNRSLAADAAPALIESLKDPNAFVRRKASEALSNTGEAGIPVLCQALADPDPRVRVGAVRALGDLLDPDFSKEPGPDELATVTPLVKKLLDDPDPDVRTHAAIALRQMRCGR
jgi:HEAT repeat protein